MKNIGAFLVVLQSGLSAQINNQGVNTMKTGRTTISVKTSPPILSGWHKVTQLIVGSLAFLLMIWAFALDTSGQAWEVLPDVANSPSVQIGASVGFGTDWYFIGQSSGGAHWNSEVWHYSESGNSWQFLAQAVDNAAYQGKFYALAVDVKNQYLYVGGHFGGLAYTKNGSQDLTATDIARYNLHTGVWEGVGYVDISPSHQDGWIQAVTTDARGNVYIGTFGGSTQNQNILLNAFQECTDGHSWTPINGLLAAGGNHGITALASDGFNVYIAGDIGGAGPSGNSAVSSRGIIKYNPPPPPPPGPHPYIQFPPRGFNGFTPVGGNLSLNGHPFALPGVFNNTSEYSDSGLYWNDAIGIGAGSEVNSIAVVGREVWAVGGFLLPANGIARFPTVEGLGNNNLPIDNLLSTDSGGGVHNGSDGFPAFSIAAAKIGPDVGIPYVSGYFNTIGALRVNGIARWWDPWGPSGLGPAQPVWQPLAGGLGGGPNDPAVLPYLASGDGIIADGGFQTVDGQTYIQVDIAARWLKPASPPIPVNPIDFTFQSGTTYSINGNIQFSGTTTIEPGAIINCANSTMEIDGNLICPSIATATLNGGTLMIPNNPNLSSVSHLSFVGTTLDFQLRSSSPAAITVSDCRFVGCGITWEGASSPYSLVLNNCLAGNPPGGSPPNAFLSDNTGRGSFRLVNCTLDNWHYPVHNNNYQGSGNGDGFIATNCIFSEIALAYGGGDNPSQTGYSGSYNGFYEYAYANSSQTPFGGNQVLSDWPFYQSPTIDDSSYYLVTYSVCHNTGTANIDPALLAELKGERTTYAPGDGGFPDNDGMLDLGYHYATANPTAPCDPAPTGIVALWSAEGDANDSIGRNNGQLEGGVTFASGAVGQALDFNTADAAVEVPASPTLNVGPSGGFTVEAWLSPAQISTANQWLFGWKSQSGDYGVNINLSQDGPAGCLFLNVKDTYNDNNVLVSGAVMADNVFQHVAFTYDQNSGIATIYYNGAVVAQQQMGSFVADTTEDFILGERAAPNDYDNTYQGLMDEVTLYDRALSPDEIAGIYNAGSAGKCFTPPSCDPAPTGIAAEWSAEGNANDSIGGNNGQLGGGLTFTAGEVGQAFNFNTADAAVEVPASSSLDVGANGGFTVEAWLSPTQISTANQWLFGWKSQSGDYGVNINLSQDGPAGCLFLNVKDTYSDNNVLVSGAVVANNVFQHVAFTYDQNSGMATIYYNGEVVAQQQMDSFVADTTEDFILGERAAPNDYDNTYQGLMDEVTVYNRALSQSEIAAIFNAGSAGKCPTQ